MRAAWLIGAALLVAAPAHADQDEASIHVQVVGGVAQLGDDAAGGATASASFGGVEGRASYAISDWYQLDTSLTVTATGAAHFANGDFSPPGAPPVSGPFGVSEQLLRLDAGVTARLGVRFIPTVRVALGAQARRTSSPTGFPGTVRAAQLGTDLVAHASIGFDYRVNRRTIVGVAVGGSYAVPLGGASYRDVEVTAFWSYYWYPR